MVNSCPATALILVKCWSIVVSLGWRISRPAGAGQYAFLNDKRAVGVFEGNIAPRWLVSRLVSVNAMQWTEVSCEVSWDRRRGSPQRSWGIKRANFGLDMAGVRLIQPAWRRVALAVRQVCTEPGTSAVTNVLEDVPARVPGRESVVRRARTSLRAAWPPVSLK